MSGLIGWGPRSFGKRAGRQSGLAEDDYPRARLLADTGRFLQEDGRWPTPTRLLAARSVAAAPGGPLLLGKAYLPNTARSGTFYVHVLLDAARKLSPAALGPDPRQANWRAAAVAPMTPPWAP